MQTRRTCTCRHPETALRGTKHWRAACGESRKHVSEGGRNSALGQLACCLPYNGASHPSRGGTDRPFPCRAPHIRRGAPCVSRFVVWSVGPTVDFTASSYDRGHARSSCSSRPLHNVFPCHWPGPVEHIGAEPFVLICHVPVGRRVTRP